MNVIAVSETAFQAFAGHALDYPTFEIETLLPTDSCLRQSHADEFH